MNNQEDISQTVTRILELKKGEDILLPESLVQLLQRADFSKSKGMEIHYVTQYTETSFGGSSGPTYTSGPLLLEEEGVLVIATETASEGNDYNRVEEGYKLYLLRDGKLALFSYTSRANTFGRISGLGYTGYEEVIVKYNAKVEKLLELNSEGRKVTLW